MQKILWLFLSLAAILVARENPFETSMSPVTVGKTTQLQEEKQQFSNTTLTLPSSARILKSVTVTFQNLDGSISEEIVAVDQTVDWHYPLILSSHLSDDTNAKSLTSVTTVSAKDNKSVEKKESEAVKEVKKIERKEILPPEPKTEKNVIEMAGITFKLTEDLSFFIHQNEITVFTQDKKIRDFLIADPYKIVIDFKQESAFATKTLHFEKAPFLSVTLGSHEGFYRIAILLDGHYRYDWRAFDGGYVIKLK